MSSKRYRSHQRHQKNNMEANIFLIMVFILGLLLVNAVAMVKLYNLIVDFYNAREVTARITTNELRQLADQGDAMHAINAKLSNSDGSSVNLLITSEAPKVVLK